MIRDLLDRVIIIENRYGSGYTACFLRDDGEEFSVIDCGITGSDIQNEKFSYLSEPKWCPIAEGVTRIEALRNLEDKASNLTSDDFSAYCQLLMELTKVNLHHMTFEQREEYFTSIREQW